MREITQQTVGVGAFARLARHAKKTWPAFPISIGKFTLANRQHAAKEAHELAELHLCKAPHRFFDPIHEVRNVFLGFNLLCPEHQSDPEEEKFQDIFNYVEKHKEIADPETITQVRFQAINTMEDLFRMRDILLQSPTEDIMQAEENRKQERMERWEKAVEMYKKKPPTASRKGGTSTQSATSLQTQAKSIEEHTSKDIPEKTDAKGGAKGLEER